MEKFFESLLDLKLITVIPALIGLLLFKPSFVTLFTASRSEKIMLGKELRLLIIIIGYFLYAIFLPIMTIYLINDVPFFRNFLLNKVVLAFVIPFFAYLIYLNIGDFLNKSFLPKSTKQREIFFVAFFFYVIFVLLIFGLISFELLISTIDDKYGLIIFFTIVEFYFLLPCIQLLSKIYDEEIVVKVRLTNGETIKNAHLLHPMFGKKLLLGDKPKANYCRHKFAVPIERIEYIEFFITPVRWGHKTPKAFTTIVSYKEEPKINELFK